MNKSILNIIFILLMACSTGAVAQSTHPEISLTYHNIKLSALLDTIRVKGGLKISYDVNVIPVDSLLNIDVKNRSPENILKQILDKPGIEIIVENNQAVIRAKEVTTRKLTIKGKVLGFRSKPLPLVNISLKNKPVGTVTNNSGEFSLLLPEKFISDTLHFSCLGYKTKTIPVASVDSALTVKLTETSLSLPEIIIKYKNVNDIIELFKENQKRNYPEDKMLITAFFREAIKQDGKYVNVSEAVVQILKFPYDQPFNLEYVKFVKGRKYSDVEKIKDVKFRIEGGPFYFSRIDIARYMDFFPQDNAEPVYKYKFEGLDYEYGRMVFLISFAPIKDTGELLYKGILRIDTETYALVSAEFELSKKALKESRKYFIRKESGKIKAKPGFAKYYINYRPYKNIWLLNKIKGEMKIRVTDKNNNKRHTFIAVSEMLMSDYQKAGKTRFKPSEQFKSNYILTEQIKNYDPDFWKNYNVIRPDEDIENVFKSSHR